MPHLQSCSNCWAENLLGAIVCERCDAPLSETESNSLDQKLMRALHQPIPLVSERVAKEIAAKLATLNLLYY